MYVAPMRGDTVGEVGGGNCAYGGSDVQKRFVDHQPFPVTLNELAFLLSLLYCTV